MILKEKLNNFKETLLGEARFDTLSQVLYATDGSVYRELPLGVIFPKNVSDIQKIIAFCNENQLSIIPRAAGTSLAGQCVGNGIVVDVSKHLNNILSFDKERRTVTVQPGVVRDELNQYLASHGLFFAPNTSTSNRCTIGGMVGNNSSGTTSIQFGVTRDKVISLEVILADGALVTFTNITNETLQEKITENTLEGKIYQFFNSTFQDKSIQQQIVSAFPKASIHRRNTGYAIDEFISMQPFSEEGKPFNIAKLLAGSEGTLAFTTAITLQLDELPPKHTVMLAAHFHSVADCCNAVYAVMQHNLFTCEMMDKVILDCTKNNKTQQANRWFIEGDPQAILMLELANNDLHQLENDKKLLEVTLQQSTNAYAFPSLYHEAIGQALELRKAGLGLLGNIIGDKKAVACIEDTAVAIEDLSNYITEFSALMENYKQQAVYYAHAGAGELHLRPILNLKTSEDVALFYKITNDVAHLVKKYKGSMSGEHGDGRVRAPFVKTMIGEANYKLLEDVKAIFDPNHIFNPGKIVHAKAIDANLRYTPDRVEPFVETFLNFNDDLGIVRAAEKCNGSADCRKTHHFNGAMCPSFQATKDEKDTTRARANTLREFLTHSDKANKFDHHELKEVFDLCLSCKSCASECPSNVDVTKFKAEFLFQYRKANGTKLRDWVFAHQTKLNTLSANFSSVAQLPIFEKMLKSALGIAQQRSIPKASNYNFDKFLKRFQHLNKTKQRVILFIDEFSKHLDITVAQDAIEVLCRLQYDVALYIGDSGRSFLSKGFLPEAKQLAEKHITYFSKKEHQHIPILGLEPSAILSFRDEYPDLVSDKSKALEVAKHTFLIEEFLAKAIQQNEIDATMFTAAHRIIKIHAHCHQKALTNQKITFDMLNVPKNYEVSILNTGCCGMAGAFGYEKEHYDISMQIGALKVFPIISKQDTDTLIAANGTSCRHQIYDGTQRKALHPVTIFKEALL